MRWNRGGVGLRRKSGLWAGIFAAVAAGLVVLALSGAASATGGGTAIDFAAPGYKYSTTNTSGWEQTAFDDSSWTSAQAPFGNNAGCSFPSANTAFGSLDTIYVRKAFTVPDNAFGLHIAGTIDNVVDFWVNGTAAGSMADGFCNEGGIDIDVPNSDLSRGAANPDGQVIAAQAVGQDDGSPSFFDMKVTYGSIDFTQQPTETVKNTAMSPAVSVTITPPDGGAAIPDGTPVHLALHAISGSGTLSGGDANTVGGVATFTNLKVSASGLYNLVASSQGAQTTSGNFLIDDQLANCSGTCNAGGTNGGTTFQAAADHAGNSKLGISVIGDANPPAGACGGGSFHGVGAGSFIHAVGDGSAHPNFTVTWQLDKSLVKQAGNPGAAHFDICLGAGDASDQTHTWKTKDGSDAAFPTDDGLGKILYWGLMPDCPKKGALTNPCILQRKKTGAGDVFITFYLPFPWDSIVHGG